MRCRGSHDFGEALAATGLRPTPRRLALLEALHARGALSADEAAAVAGKIAPMDRVTSYRNLEALAATGLVTATGEAAAATRYEIGDHHTHAIVCARCGKTERLDSCGLDRLDRAALRASRSFARIHGHSLSWAGICRGCDRPAPARTSR